ncbi:MAG TPA: hypothetical protein EYP14_03700, partial [Planctomycetaceae bacterium]|nr:hypothetical protein [Planctomycetaceae bacterium]
ALKLKEIHDCHVTVLSVGGEACETVLREFLACGADKAVWLEENRWEPDSGGIAERIAAYYRDHPFQLGLFGYMDSDIRSGHVGPMFAVLTGMPYAGPVIDVQWEGQEIIVWRRRKKRREKLRLTLPACLGILRGQPLRYHSLSGKLRAEETEILRLRPAEHLSPRLGRIRFTRPKPRKRSLASTRTEGSSLEKIQQALGLESKGARRESSILTGDPEEAARKALELIRNEKILY